jgi:MOSC domain-containing protein YiiM
LSNTDLEAGLEYIRSSPRDGGTLSLIVARPSKGERTVLDTAELDVVTGLVGDNWSLRSKVDPDAQLNVMNSRSIEVIEPDADRRPLAGDQLYLDLDLSDDNLPAGSRLALGTGGAVIEITPKPHTGCAQFASRFGAEATRFVNTGEGKRLHLRGVCARVVAGGTIRVGDPVTKV